MLLAALILGSVELLLDPGVEVQDMPLGTRECVVVVIRLVWIGHSHAFTACRARHENGIHRISPPSARFLRFKLNAWLRCLHVFVTALPPSLLHLFRQKAGRRFRELRLQIAHFDVALLRTENDGADGVA